MAKLEAFITTIQIYDDKEVPEQLRKIADVLDRVEKVDTPPHE